MPNSRDVISDYVRKLHDGTLHAVEIYARSGDRLGAYLQPAARGYIQITTGDVFTKSLDDFRAVIDNEDTYAWLERERFAPCFHPAHDFEPFERADPLYDLFASAEEDEEEAFKESFMSPVYMQRLRLVEIERRFPGGDNGTPGDKDVRNRLFAQSYMFQFNYKHLNRLRLSAVNRAMLACSAVSLVTAGLMAWALAQPAVVTTPLRLLVAMVADHLGRLAPAVTWLGLQPVMLGIIALAAVLAAYAARAAIAGITGHFHGIHRGLFVSITSASCAKVSKAVTSRQDNLHYLERSMTEEIDRSREAAWATSGLPQWVARSRRWLKTVFWIHERMNAIEETMMANMKIIGQQYSGLRAAGRLKALLVARSYQTAAAVAALACVVFAILATQAGVAGSLVIGLAFVLHMAGHFGRLATLHNLVKAFDEPQSIQVIINLASTAYTKGYKDSALHDVVGGYLEREKRKMMMEEEKLRGK